MVDDTYPQMPIIETKNYLLRPARLNDAEDMFEYYKQSKVVEYLPMSSHKTVSDTRRFIKSFFIFSKSTVILSLLFVKFK